MKLLKRGTALLLSFAILAGLVGSGLLIHTLAESAMSWYTNKYDDLSRFYEIGNSSDGPGCIASTPGDPGGKSYGLYMFASNSKTPLAFVKWCQSSDNGIYKEIGDTLYKAYSEPSPGYGINFDDAWRRVNSANSAAFGQAQYDYTMAKFYTPLVSAIEGSVGGFKISNYSVALKNVFWSRAVQHGVDGASSLIKRAFAALGGFANQPENQLIQAIYNESGRLVTPEELRSENGKTGAETMSGNDANKYGITGKIMRYYYGCSGDVQFGVYSRLRVREVADALVMRMNNKSDSAAEGSYQILLNSADQKLALDAAGGTLALNAKGIENSVQTFSLAHYEGGFYTLTVTVGGSSLRLAAGQGGVTLAKPDTSDSQKWLLEEGASGRLLKNAATGTYLSYHDNTLVMAAPTEEAPASTWYLSPVTGSASDWTLSGVIYPTKDNILVAQSSGFPVRGVISCSAPITNINIRVTSKSGASPINANASPNATAYNLMRLDDSVAFSGLSAGDYTYTLTATAGGSTVKLAESQFTVTQGSGQVWDDETYTVTFDPNGGTLNGSSTKTVKLSDIVYGKLPTASKEGYSFIGWFTAKEGGEQIMSGNKIVASDLTLYAQYADVYTYTFLDADGDIYQRGTVAQGELIPAPLGTPAKAPDGKNTYRFSYWDGYTEGKTVMEAKDMTFTPVYTATPLEELPNSAGYWKGLTPGTTASQLGKGVTVYDGKTAVSSTATICTGMTAVVDNKSYTLVVKGDVNGDGRITITDVVALQSHILDKKALTDAYKEAADLNGDGKITITDVVKAARVIVGKDTIS